MKTLVPGLYRGVEVWRQLCATDTASLDQLSVQTGYPKASVLRMLKTLCDLQLVERRDDGLYRAIARIAGFDGAEPDFEQAVFQTLEKLSITLNSTAEWYEPDAQGLLLTQRCSPPDVEVRVKARAGFVREWGHEIEAVAALGYAFFSAAPTSRAKLWTYDTLGVKKFLSANDARERINTARRAGVLTDENYNNNGVKRIAAAVMRGGKLAGVLSLSMAFIPSLELKLSGMADVLRQAADELQQP
ncbi:MAG: helix-turn-helix domain-containing protein [Verrucomicrobiota bacterium]|nr:helix-turn-helix domain-containing protein [Verrucomicrobiota bacterium]